MAYELSYVSAPPVWDTLPVYLLKHYPYTQGSYRPLCEIRGAVFGAELVFRLTAYEWKFLEDTLPGEGSCINLFLKNSDAVLAVIIEHGKPAKVLKLQGATQTKLPLPNEPVQFSGEDNTGDFWGVNLQLANSLLAEIGLDRISINDTLSIQVTKTQADLRAFHYGSLGVPTSPTPVFFDEGAFVPFLITNY